MMNNKEIIDRQKIETAKNSSNELRVSDDFCGDCKRKFNNRDEQIIKLESTTYGVYYDSNQSINLQTLCQL